MKHCDKKSHLHGPCRIIKNRNLILFFVISFPLEASMTPLEVVFLQREGSDHGASHVRKSLGKKKLTTLISHTLTKENVSHRTILS